MLDTDICIEIIRGRSASAVRKMTEYQADRDIGVSIITVAELEAGVRKSAKPKENRAALVEFCNPLVVVAFDWKAAETYGVIRADLERAGTVIGPLDFLIAAHALSLGATLITNNVREFSRVRKLEVENWLTE